jgi:hypothetical protein
MSELLIPDARWVLDGWSLEPGGEEVMWVLHSISPTLYEWNAVHMTCPRDDVTPSSSFFGGVISCQIV